MLGCLYRALCVTTVSSTRAADHAPHANWPGSLTTYSTITSKPRRIFPAACPEWIKTKGVEEGIQDSYTGRTLSITHAPFIVFCCRFWASGFKYYPLEWQDRGIEYRPMLQLTSTYLKYLSSTDMKTVLSNCRVFLTTSNNSVIHLHHPVLKFLVLFYFSWALYREFHQCFVNLDYTGDN